MKYYGNELDWIELDVIWFGYRVSQAHLPNNFSERIDLHTRLVSMNNIKPHSFVCRIHAAYAAQIWETIYIFNASIDIVDGKHVIRAYNYNSLNNTLYIQWTPDE